MFVNKQRDFRQTALNIARDEDELRLTLAAQVIMIEPPAKSGFLSVLITLVCILELMQEGFL